MKYTIVLSTLLATSMARATGHKSSASGHTSCESEQTVICSGNGSGDLLSLGNIAPGLLGDYCSGGNVYCCSTGDVDQTGLINLNLNLQCSLNDLL